MILNMVNQMRNQNVCQLLPCNCAAAEGDNQLYEKQTEQFYITLKIVFVNLVFEYLIYSSI